VNYLLYQKNKISVDYRVIYRTKFNPKTLKNISEMTRRIKMLKQNFRKKWSWVMTPPLSKRLYTNICIPFSSKKKGFRVSSEKRVCLMFAISFLTMRTANYPKNTVNWILSHGACLILYFNPLKNCSVIFTPTHNFFNGHNSARRRQKFINR